MSEPTICVIPVEGPVTAEYFTDEGLDAIIAALGTNEIDKTLIYATEEWGVYAWVGDHSLNDGSPKNSRATTLRDMIRKDYGHDPHPVPLCGPVVLMAFDRKTGDSIDFRGLVGGLNVEGEG